MAALRCGAALLFSPSSKHVALLLRQHEALALQARLDLLIEGNVRDVPAFREFIAEYEPTPEQLRAVYPDLTLVLPGDIATKELRMNNSRFFAELNEDGRIVDGRFQ